MPTLLDCRIPHQEWLKEAGNRNGTSTRSEPLREDRKSLADAGPWKTALSEIVAIHQLEDNWDGQGAQAPSQEVLDSAIGLACTLCAHEVEPPSRVVPGPDGTVIFEWQDSDGSYTEIEIVGWLCAEVMQIEPGRPARHWTLPTE